MGKGFSESHTILDVITYNSYEDDLKIKLVVIL